jgi:hypothetical protein
MLLTVLQVLAAIVGTLAFYLRLFMYEDEEGKWQNRIVKLWVDIDDRAKLTGSKTSALVNSIATIVTRAFDRSFGRKLLSFQFIGVSSCYSLAGSWLLAFFVLMILSRPSDPLGLGPVPQDLSKALPFMEHFLLVGGLIFLLLAVLPSIISSRWLVGLSLIPVFFLTAVLVGELIGRHHVPEKHVAFFAALLASLLSDILLLILVRFSIRWLFVETNVSRIILSVLIQIGVFTIVIVIPLGLGVGLLHSDRVPRSGLSRVLEDPSTLLLASDGIASLNAFTGLGSCLFLLVLLFVLLHKVFWPLLRRLFYPLARYEVIRNHKFLTRLGTTCYAFTAAPNILRAILQLLAN